MNPPHAYPDRTGAVVRAGTDPTFEGRELQDTLRRAIATHRGHCDWTVDLAGWVVLLSPEEQTFSGRTLEEALAWCLRWQVRPENGVGLFVA